MCSKACEKVATGSCQSAFAIIRPPGHHAMAAKASGFCFFNNVAIGARYLQRKHNLHKILVVDFDVHHGDGTQKIFYDDDTVMFCSIHRNPIFPMRGKDPGAEAKLADKIGAVGDLLGDSLVTANCYGLLETKLISILEGKIVFALEGGYNPKSLSDACVESLRSLLGEGKVEPTDYSYEMTHAETWEAISNAYSSLREFWQMLEAIQLPPPSQIPLPPDQT